MHIAENYTIGLRRAHVAVHGSTDGRTDGRVRVGKMKRRIYRVALGETVILLTSRSSNTTEIIVAVVIIAVIIFP